jgi:hypothetical protein
LVLAVTTAAAGAGASAPAGEHVITAAARPIAVAMIGRRMGRHTSRPGNSFTFESVVCALVVQMPVSSAFRAPVTLRA